MKHFVGSLLEAVKRQGAYGCYQADGVLVCQRVEDFSPVELPDDHAGAVKREQVLRGVLLRDLDRVSERLNGSRCSLQSEKKLDPRRVSEGPHACNHELELRIGDRVLATVKAHQIPSWRWGGASPEGAGRPEVKR